MSHTSGFAVEFPLSNRCLGRCLSHMLGHCAQALAGSRRRAPPGMAFIYAGADMQIACAGRTKLLSKDWQTLFRGASPRRSADRDRLSATRARRATRRISGRDDRPSATT